MEKQVENLIEIKEALDRALIELKKEEYRKAYYELDMASIGITVSKMRCLEAQQKHNEIKTKKADLKPV